MNQGRYGFPTYSPPAMELIAEIITSGTQPEVVFTNIPSGFRDLDLRIRARSASGTDAIPQIQFNGDTGNNYAYCRANRFGSDLQTAIAYIQANTIPNSGTFDLPVRSCTIVTISDYANTVEKKATHSVGGGILAVAGGTIITEQVAGMWKSLDVIHRIRVFLSSGSFADGSSLSLYGVR